MKSPRWLPPPSSAPEAPDMVSVTPDCRLIASSAEVRLMVPSISMVRLPDVTSCASTIAELSEVSSAAEIVKPEPHRAHRRFE